MLKYSAKDIIRRAEQLADLEDSDFISDREKRDLLNEAWARVYQKTIDADDRTWLKSAEAFDGMELPADFFQLSGLFVVPGRIQVLKRNNTQASGYEIRNGRLHLSRDYSGRQCVMEYHPCPPPLFYNSGKRRPFDIPSPPRVLLDEGFYVDMDEAKVKDFDGNTLCNIKNPEKYLNFKNGRVDTDGYFCDYSILADTNGDNYTQSIETRKDKPFVVAGNTVTHDDITGASSDWLLYMTDGAGGKGYPITRNLRVLFQDGKETGITLTTSYALFCREDGLFISHPSCPYITKVSPDGVERFPLGLVKFCAFVDDMDFIGSLGESFYRMGYGADTVLDYPNNIYYTLLANSLAVSFKLKQNGDASALESKEAEAWAQFYESVSRDANTNAVIKNVYGNGGRSWW